MKTIDKDYKYLAQGSQFGLFRVMIISVLLGAAMLYLIIGIL